MRYIINLNNTKTLEIFTEKRIQILKIVKNKNPSSIRELARLVERDIKNVWADLELLCKFNLIDLMKNGRSKKPVVKYKTLIIKF